MSTEDALGAWTGHFAAAGHADVEAVLDVQLPGAVIALAAAFPQDRYPFPRDAIAARWHEEIDDGAVDVFVWRTRDNRVVGFAATKSEELLHFGTHVESWGSGLADRLHDAAVDHMRSVADAGVLRLRVFEVNERAKRFYRRHSWRPTGTVSHSPFEPYPALLHYELGFVRSVAG